MTAFHLTIIWVRPDHHLWSQVYPTLPEKGRLWMDLAYRFHPNTLTARRGLWKTPWPMTVHPQLAMPAYDPKFSKTFAEVSDQRAIEVRDIIRQGKKVALYYSGGIDSTVCATALLKTLTPEELKQVAFCCSINSATENPVFFDRYIRGKMTIFDSSKNQYNDVIDKGYMPITADAGDDIFGTEQATQFYFSYARLVDKLSGAARTKLALLRDSPKLMELPYREFVDLLIPFFSPAGTATNHSRQVGEWFYNKLTANVATSDVPIYSLHDLFWWLIFNLRFTHCSLRGPLLYFRGDDVKSAITEYIINWFNTPEYQRWSMVNNNNGQKIRKPASTHYKWAARCYIYEFDRNDWYFHYKIKSVSLNQLIRNKRDATAELFALDANYRRYWMHEPGVQGLIEDGLQSFDE
jgi:hypothetical protein